MLINILTAVNMSDCFNQKTQKEILFDLANLLRDLNPNKFPAFAFAWLELLSHKLFLPHFLKKSTGSSNENSADLNKSSFESEEDNKNEEKNIQRESNAQNQRWYKLKELLVQSFTFLKYNLVPGKPVPQAL